jgi:hypothetical protein
MKLVFYSGPGNLITKLIRMLTCGPYSHVELQFANGCRFFASGHGEYTGSHIVCDHRTYGKLWHTIRIPASRLEERDAQRFAFHLIGFPFGWKGLLSFLLPCIDRRRTAKYCSSIILDVLQNSMHLFPGVELKISPNGLFKLCLDNEFLEDTTIVSADKLPPLKRRSS